MNSRELERFLYSVRTWTGLAMIVLLAIQIFTGYALVGKVAVGPFSYQEILFLHAQFSWLFIYSAATHAAVNLRFLYRRWWPNRESTLTWITAGTYVLVVLLTLYIQFFK